MNELYYNLFLCLQATIRCSCADFFFPSTSVSSSSSSSMISLSVMSLLPSSSLSLPTLSSTIHSLTRDGGILNVIVSISVVLIPRIASDHNPIHWEIIPIPSPNGDEKIWPNFLLFCITLVLLSRNIYYFSLGPLGQWSHSNPNILPFTARFEDSSQNIL